MASSPQRLPNVGSPVSPNANIIFGATLKPDMEDELVITVIATGFDSETFHNQDVDLETPTTPSYSSDSDVDEEMVKNIDLELDQEQSAEKFAAEEETNIWDTPPAEDDEDDTPAFLRRRKKNKE